MLLFFTEPSANTKEEIRKALIRFGSDQGCFENTNISVPSGWKCFLTDSLVVSSREDLVRLRSELSRFRIDVLSVKRRIVGQSLFCFDMDSTLIREEVIDELARFAGVYEEVSLVTREAMEGNLNFQDALRKRCSYLKDLPVTALTDLYSRLSLNEGVSDLLQRLRGKGTKTAVFSGGFQDILERFRTEHPIDEVRANFLERKDGKLTGNVSGRIVDKDVKKESLIELREKFRIERENVIAVGDGANDQLMLSEAGIGIGFHAKEGLKNAITNWVDFAPMDVLLYLFES